MRTVANQGNGLRSLLVRVGVVLLLATGGLVVWGQPSMAATCSGSTCSGKNPQTAGCSPSGVTKLSKTWDEQTTAEIRYSSTCKAWWARVRTDTPDPTCVVWAQLKQQKWMHSPEDGTNEWLTTSVMRLVTPHYANCQGEQTWSYMIPDASSNDRYNVCVTWTTSPTIVPSDDAYDTCTAWL
jgi:hypothetical protein